MVSDNRMKFPAVTPDGLYEQDRRRREWDEMDRRVTQAQTDNVRTIRRLQEVNLEIRLQALHEAMIRRGYLTALQAWELGHFGGFYVGGDGSLARDDLNRLCQRNQAEYHDGFWRHINEPDHIRQQHKHWSDYWTPR